MRGNLGTSSLTLYKPKPKRLNLIIIQSNPPLTYLSSSQSLLDLRLRNRHFWFFKPQIGGPNEVDSRKFIYQSSSTRRELHSGGINFVIRATFGYRIFFSSHKVGMFLWFSMSLYGSMHVLPSILKSLGYFASISYLC